jgi:hypothetical protein
VLLIRTSRGATDSFSILVPSIDTNNNDEFSTFMLSAITHVKQPPSNYNGTASDKAWATILAQDATRKEKQRQIHQERTETINQIVTARHTTPHNNELLSSFIDTNKTLALAIEKLTTVLERMSVDNAATRASLEQTITHLHTSSTAQMEHTERIIDKLAK